MKIYAAALACLILLSGCREGADPEGGPAMAGGADYVVVELRSGTLAAFDLPYEGARYEVPGFEPGLYKVPLGAIRNATDAELEAESQDVIYVDSATIFLVDADYHQRLRDIENRIWQETRTPDMIFSGCTTPWWPNWG